MAKTNRPNVTTNGSRASGSLSQTIGSRLRSLRKSQDLTLVELSQATGVDIATISRIETGRMAGTLESHMKLARGLGTKLTQLYAGIEEAQAREATSVQEPGARPDVSVFHGGKASTTLLTKDVLKRKLMPTLLTIDAGGSTQREELKLGSERFVYVLDGGLDVALGEEHHHLPRGSTIYFDASLQHQFKNSGQKTARAILITTPPAL